MAAANPGKPRPKPRTDEAKDPRFAKPRPVPYPPEERDDADAAGDP